MMESKRFVHCPSQWQVVCVQVRWRDEALGAGHLSPQSEPHLNVAVVVGVQVLHERRLAAEL